MRRFRDLFRLVLRYRLNLLGNIAFNALGSVLSLFTFLAIVPVGLFLLFPVLLSLGSWQDGLLESLGRMLLGVLLFVFCAAHLGLLVRCSLESTGLIGGRARKIRPSNAA